MTPLHGGGGGYAGAVRTSFRFPVFDAFHFRGLSLVAITCFIANAFEDENLDAANKTFLGEFEWTLLS